MGNAKPVVGDGPGHVDRPTLLCIRRYQDRIDHQIRRGRLRYGYAARDCRVVLIEDKLEWSIESRAGNDDVQDTTKTVRNQHFAGALVAATHFEVAEMPKPCPGTIDQPRTI